MLPSDKPIKRFILFHTIQYEEQGGLNDAMASYNNLEELRSDPDVAKLLDPDNVAPSSNVEVLDCVGRKVISDITILRHMSTEDYLRS